MNAPPPDVLVVSDRELRSHARNLVRAMASYQPLSGGASLVVEWCFDAEFEEEARMHGQPRNIFLGDSKYARFLRSLAKNHERMHGVVWCTYKQHGFVYTEDVIIDLRATLPKLEKSLAKLRADAQYKAESSSWHEGVPEGPLMAHAFLDAAFEQGGVTLDNKNVKERELRPLFNRLQYVLGIGWFLMQGWDQVALPPAK